MRLCLYSWPVFLLSPTCHLLLICVVCCVLCMFDYLLLLLSSLLHVCRPHPHPAPFIISAFFFFPFSFLLFHTHSSPLSLSFQFSFSFSFSFSLSFSLLSSSFSLLSSPSTTSSSFLRYLFTLSLLAFSSLLFSSHAPLHPPPIVPGHTHTSHFLSINPTFPHLPFSFSSPSSFPSSFFLLPSFFLP